MRRRRRGIGSVPSMVRCAVVVLGGFTQAIARADALAPASEPPLTTAAEIRALAEPGRFRELPVRLTGVVTHVEPGGGLIFFEDRTGAAVIEVASPPAGLVAGRLLSVTGTTLRSTPLPHVRATHLEVLAVTSLPVARRVPAVEVVAGIREGERVELEGIVRRGGARENRTFIKLATTTALIEATVDGMQPAEAERLADARVRVVGVAGSTYNQLQQWIGSRLFVGRAADVRVLAAAPASAFDLPLVAASQVSGGGALVRRVRVQGVVTRHRVGSGLYLRDGATNLYLETAQGPTLEPGDLVEAVGFPSTDRYAPTLEDAAFRKTGVGTPPAPFGGTAGQIVREAREAELVRVEGRLLDSLQGAEESRLLMAADGVVFVGRLMGSKLNPLLAGSQLALTGVVYLKEGGRSFDLFLRSADDIALIKAPSPWTPPRLLALLAGVALLGAVWVASLRVRLRRQARFIEAQVEREAALTEQARLRAAVENAASEWQRTIDALEEVVVILDRDGCVLRLNRAARDAAGGSYASCLGRQLSDLGPGEPWAKGSALVKELVAHGTVAPLTIQDQVSGRFWDLTASAVPHGAAGDRIILVARDVTHTAELQESVRRSETMAAMGSLVAGVAHEVRNPLFAISVSVDALQAELEGSRDIEDLLGVLHREVERLRVLMEDLLEYGKPISTALSDGPLEVVIDHAIQSCSAAASAAGVALRSAVAPETWVLRLNRDRLVEVFANLLRNAIEHSPRGSAVVLDAESFRRHAGPWVRCRVIDEGPGFRPEDLPRIFEPFFSRRRGGTGLGLAIVRRIVEEHGGQVHALNRDQGGAVMVVELPCVER